MRPRDPPERCTSAYELDALLYIIGRMGYNHAQALLYTAQSVMISFAKTQALLHSIRKRLTKSATTPALVTHEQTPSGITGAGVHLFNGVHSKE